jgi:PD-(D/E)XK nuclease superfamily
MGLYIVETKTSGEDISQGSVFWLRTRMDTQIGVYWRAALQEGLDVRGVCYDALAKPACKPYQATPPESRKYTKPTKKEPVARLYANQRDRDETPEEYEARCMAMIAEDPNAYYQRNIVVRLEQEHHECASDIWATTQAMRDAKRLKMYPRHPDSCVQWSRPCEMLPICSGMADANDPMLYRRETAQHEELDLLDDDRTRVTQSSIRTFRSCPRKYELRYLMGIRSLIRPEPLLTGTSIHAGIEALRKGASLDEALAKVENPERRFASAKERAMLRGYYARWGSPRGIIAVEKQFEVELVNPATNASSKTFRLAGKWDGLAECEEWELLDPRRRP